MDKQILNAFHNGHPCCRSLVEHVEMIMPTCVLDIGCGDGRDLNFLLKNNLIEYGVGVDDHHTPYVYDKFNTAERLIFHKMDVQEFLGKITNDYFDFVVSNNSFEHFDHPIQILKELCRVIKENGHLFITLPYKNNHWDPDHKLACSEIALQDIVGEYFHTLECGLLDGGNMYIFVQKVTNE